VVADFNSGAFWLAGMLNDEDLCIVLAYDEMQLSLREADSHVDSLLDIVSWLSEPGNWDISVGERVHKPQRIPSLSSYVLSA
jgi:hypothetical protein